MLLQQPGHIGGLRLKNRVVMAPMGTNYSTTDGLSTARDVAYYAERARGGVAALVPAAPPISAANVPPFSSAPAASNLIGFAGTSLTVPN